MHILIILLFIFIYPLNAYTSNTCQTPYSNNLALDNRNILIFTDAHCSACKRFYRDLDTHAILAKMMTDIPCFQVSTTKNLWLFADYDVEAAPTFIFIDNNGNELHRYEGYFKPMELINYMKELGY